MLTASTCVCRLGVSTVNYIAQRTKRAKQETCGTRLETAGYRVKRGLLCVRVLASSVTLRFSGSYGQKRQGTERTAEQKHGSPVFSLDRLTITRPVSLTKQLG